LAKVWILPSGRDAMIDINNPDHEAALRWARVQPPGSWHPVQYIGGDRYDALYALSSPASAAELIRQLVERAGTQKHVAPGSRGVVVRPSKAESVDEEEFWFNIRDTSALITRLLALAPNAGAEAVLRALRGES